MQLKRLTVGEMISISEPWINPASTEYQTIKEVPELAGLLPHIEKAHQDLLKTQPARTTERAKALSEEALQLDLRHDCLARGIYLYLNSMIELTDNADQKTEVQKIQDVLYPEGLTAIQKSYREEAGAAMLLQSRLQPELKNSLSQLPVRGAALWQYVEEWMATGRKLGELEDRRALELQGQAQLISPADVVKARNNWIKAVNALCANIEFLSSTQQTVQQVITRLQIAEQNASRRGHRRSSAAETNTASTITSDEPVAISSPTMD